MSTTIVAAAESDHSPRFALGDRVHLLQFDGAHAYVVGGPRAYSSGWEDEVLLEGATNGPFWQAEHQLTLCLKDKIKWQSPDAFRRDLLLAKLRLRLSDTLYTYRASRTLFEPYQFRPVLRFLASQQQRLLIADEVGLGKTIEAAMIYLELKARLGSELKRVLVVCPSKLRFKWQDELRSRFDEEFYVLRDAQEVRSLLFGGWRNRGDTQHFRYIVSYELLRSEVLAREWAELGIRLDFVIADEAHVMRNRTALVHKLGAVLTDNADAAVFLTATPLMLKTDDLFNLLHLLTPDDYDDVRTFGEQIRPNAYVNQAAVALGEGDPQRARDRLRFVEMTMMRERFRKDPRYQDVLAALDTLIQAGDPPSREDRVRVQRQVLELNVLSAIYTRTRKREAGNAKPREAVTVKVALSQAERDFYDAFLAQVRRDAMQANPHLNQGAATFAVIMRERMAASCLVAARQALIQSFQQHMAAPLQVERSEFHLTDEDDDERQAEEEWLRSTGELLALAQRIGDDDAKFDLFAETLQRALAGSDTSKALVFSYFHGTLQYLLDRLRKLGYKVDVIHGRIGVEERQKTIERFRTDPKFRVLLSSEVGSEGLDFQFCDVLVNYDLPWNPMQVEQRIGRLDRFGQLADKIRIFNFAIDDTIETRILGRLYDRIGIFERSIGDLEAILGEEIRDLSLKVFRADLSPEQEIEEAKKAANRIEIRRQNVEQLEAQQDELIGQGAILDAAVDSAVRAGHVVHAKEVRALVQTFLNEAIDPPPGFDRDDDEDAWTLRITPPLRELLLPYTQDGRHDAGSTERFKKLVATNGAVVLTFDADLARRRPLLELVTARHALALAARSYWERLTTCVVPSTSVEVAGPPSEVGNGHVFVYAVIEDGVSRQARLQAVVVHDDGSLAPGAAERILSALATAERPAMPIPQATIGIGDGQLEADRHMAGLRNDIQMDREKRNAAVIAARRAAIAASFDAKERSIRSALAATLDANARRMNEGRLYHLTARRAAKLAELDQHSSVSVSSQLVAVGRVRIVPAEARVELDQTPTVDVGVEQAPSLPETPSTPGALVDVASESVAAPAPIRAQGDSDDGSTIAPQVAVESDESGDRDAAAEGHTLVSAPADDGHWPGHDETAEAAMAQVALAEQDRGTDDGGEHVLETDEPAPVPSAVPTSASESALLTEGDSGASRTVSIDETAHADATEPAQIGDAQPARLHDDGPAGARDAAVAEPEGTDMKPAPVAVPMRGLHFPEAGPVGWLSVRPADDDGAWKTIGPAQGKVEVPADSAVRLEVDRAAADLSWLSALAPDDLTSLVLDGSYVDQVQAQHVSSLSGLRELFLVNAPIADWGIRAVLPLEGLVSLRLSGSQLSDLDPLLLKTLTRLRLLDLSDTTINDGGVSHLTSLTAIEELSLAHTRVGNGSLMHAGKLPALRRLDVRGTQATRFGLRWLRPDVEVLLDQE
ncbi:MAG: SNF2-related protein [Chloroflexota bacterium]